MVIASVLNTTVFCLSCYSSLVSPTSDGAGAAILASEDFVRKHHLEKQAVEILAQEMVTDLASTFDENSCIKMVRHCHQHDMTADSKEC